MVYVACIVQGVWTIIVLIAFLFPRSSPLEMSSLEVDPTFFEPKGSTGVVLELPSTDPPSINTEGLRPTDDGGAAHADGSRIPNEDSPVSVSFQWGAPTSPPQSCPV